MGLNKEECLKAIDVIARYCADRKGEPVPPRFELTNELDTLVQLIEECFKLEKALDKACSRLEEMDKALNVYDHLAYWDAEEWKEWCLKDE